MEAESVSFNASSMGYQVLAVIHAFFSSAVCSVTLRKTNSPRSVMKERQPNVGSTDQMRSMGRQYRCSNETCIIRRGWETGSGRIDWKNKVHMVLSGRDLDSIAAFETFVEL